MTMLLAQLQHFISHSRNIMVLTGAGISEASGIPTYRDHTGKWKSVTPIQHQEFIQDANRRKHYWARSALGWPLVSKALPNASHHLLAQLENDGYVSSLVTQNVDGLHQKAGHQQVIDLHGRLDHAKCLDCGLLECRQDIQNRLIDDNPQLQSLSAKIAPDGDAYIGATQLHDIKSPRCLYCSGILMPDVVFFGGTVSKELVALATKYLLESDALLIIGSSLTVYSGFRFCKLAQKFNKPIFAINQGQTRADDMISLKIEDDCATVLQQIHENLMTSPTNHP